MKKRALSWLLALTMLLTLAPQTLPVWASATGEKSNTATQTESKLSANTYSALGLSRNVADSEKPKDQPYGKAEVGNTIATNVINELYVNFNGSIHYGWSILDNLTMQYKDGEGIDWTSSDNFYGAMGYWRPNQQPVHYGTGNKKEGALFATNKTAGEHDDHLGKSINSANKHLTYQYSKSEAFSPNTGKDNYVAEMTIDSASQVYLYIYQVEGGNKRYVRSKFVCNASESGGDANDKTNIIYNWEYDAMYDIAAGDMDGDGYDEIAVYAQNKVYVYSFVKGVLSSPIEKTTAAPSGVNENSGKYKKLKTAVVTLAFGDLNADDKDELVIAENMTYGSTNQESDYKVGIYTLESSNLAPKKTISLKIPSDADGIFGANVMARYANVATGDIDGDYRDELIIGAYMSTHKNVQCATGGIAYMIVKGDSDNNYKNSGWKVTKNTIDLLDRVVDNKDQLIPPVALTCAATQGVGYAEQVFLGGYLYSVTGANEQKTNVEDYELNALTRISTNREYKKDNGNKANKEEIFVVNVVAGNFNGNRNGQEQIVYAFGMKHDDSDRYWYDIGYINKKDPGSTDADKSSGYWYGQEQVMNYESSYNRDSSKARASLYLSLAAVDCDDDSTLMRYKGKTVTWTKPEVLTVLQSAPYFQDLQDTRDYINQGQTGYGKGSSSSSSAIAGTSLKVGTYVSFEQDFSVFGVKVASIQAEAQSTHEFEYEFQSTKEKSIEVRYSGSAGDDYAVVYAVPYMEYQYETWVPGYTVTKDNLNTYIAQKLGKAEGEVRDTDRQKVLDEFGITIGTTVEGSWQPSSVMVPMTPANVLITVDDYDAIAEQTEGLEPIRGNILNSTPGEPATYDKINSRSNFNKIGAQQRVTTAEGGNVSLEATSEDTTEHTFAYNYEFEAKAGAGAGGVTVGVLAGLGTTAGGGVSSSQSNSYSATVDNLPKDASKYGFAWQFGWRNAKLNNNDVLVLEYQLDDVAQLPSMPKNLRVDSVTAESVTLKWDKVVGSGAYDIYQVSTTDPETKYFRARVPGTADSYTDTNVNPNNSYTYCVQNISQAGTKSIYSTTVKAITLTDANGSFVIKQQPGDKDNSIQTYVGGTATATIEAEYLKNGEPKSLSYIWQQYDTATKKWVSCSSGYGERLELSNVTEDMDGTKYRCQVLYDANLYIYSEPVTLTIGKAKSTTQLGTSVQSGATVNASYVKKEPKNTGVMDDVPVKVTIENKTYTKYTKEDVEVYLDKDGNYYSISGKTVTPLAKAIGPSALTYITGSDSDTITVKSIPYEKLQEDGSYTQNISYTYTDENGVSTTYTADEKYNGPDGLVVYKCVVTDTEGETTSTYDFWFVVIGDDQYAADLEMKTTVTVGDKHIPIDELTLATEQKETETVEETYKEGDKVTLTATPSDQSQSGLKLSGKVVFKIVNSIGDGSKTVDATIGANGTATAEWIPTAAGVYTITAAYEGNEKYMGSVSSQTITINVVVPEQKTLMIDSPNSMTYGDAAIELKTTLLKGAKNSESASVETNLSKVTYSVKNADGTEVSTGSTFDPTAAGTYTVTATYTIGSETLTATKSIVVNKRTVTIVPKVEGTGTTKTATYSLANCMTSDESLFTNKIQVTCAGTAPNAVAGEYPYTVTYTPGENETAINSKYIVVIDTMHPYVLKDDMVTVTDKTSSNNGTVTLRYRSSSTDSYVDVYGDSVPKNAEVIAVASPKAGYRVKQWKVDEQAVTTGEGGTLNTAQTITVAQSATTNHTVEAEFELVYHTLSFEVTDGSKQTGTVTAKYLKDSVESGTFVSGKRVSYFDRVQLTAKVNDGLSIKEWRITRNNGTPETLKIENEVYTGNSYVLSSITADTKVTVVTENQTACMVNIHLVNTNGEPLTRGQVAFNGATQEANPQGTFTYSGHKNDNLTVALTLPSGLVVDEWLRKDDETNTSSALQIGSFSNNKTTWNIVNLPTSLDLTVKCSTPNSYTITKSTIVQSATEDETGGTIEVYQIGRGDQVNAVLQGSDLLVKVNPVNGYQLLDVTCNNTSQMSQMGSGNEFRINGVNENIIIVATFVKKPVVTITSMENGTVEVKGTVNGVANTTIHSGNYVDYNTKLAITVKPNKGHEVTALKNGDNTFVLGGTTTDDKMAETSELTGNVTLTPTFEEIPHKTVTISVVDKNNETDGGINGSVTASVTRKGMTTYAENKTANSTTSTQTLNVYRDSVVTLSAQADSGYVAKWIYGGEELLTPPTLDFSTTDTLKDHNVQVRFDPIGQAITFTKTGENSSEITGKFKPDNGNEADFQSGNIPNTNGTLTLTVTPDDGYEVEGWYVNGTEQDNSARQTIFKYPVTHDVGAAIQVKIIRSSYAVNFSAVNGNIAATKPTNVAIESGDLVQGDTSVTFTATPAQPTGYTFDGWKINGETADRYNEATVNNQSLRLVIKEPVRVAATYTQDATRHTVTYGVDGETLGTLTTNLSASPATIANGEKATFTATPKEENYVVGWYSDAACTQRISETGEETSYSVDVYNDTTVYVKFAVKPTYTISLAKNGNGKVFASVNDGAETEVTGNTLAVKYHDKVVFRTQADDNHYFVGWQDHTKGTYTIADVTGPASVTATFAPTQSVYLKASSTNTGKGTLTATGSVTGSIATNTDGNGVQVAGGEKITLTAHPEAGQMVKEWKIGTTVQSGNLSNTLVIDSITESTTVTVEFEEYRGFTLPSAPIPSTGYTITDVVRNPDDTKAGEIRKNGDLTFKVGLAKDYTTISKLIVNGYDCVAKSGTATNCDSVTAVKNADGSYTVTIKNITAAIVLNVEAHQVVVDDLTLPKGFDKIEELNTVQKIKDKLEANMTGRKDGTAFYDIALMTWDATESKWISVDESNFPANGVDVVLPYPTGTTSNDTFKIVHMLTTAGKAGQVEEVKFTKKSDGLHFHVDSLSPFGVSWTKYVAPTPGGGGGGGAVSTCTLTFDTNGGSAIDKITKDSGTTIDLTAYKPTRAGYTFAGWFSDKALTKAVTSVKLTANTTVYAKWTQNGGTAQNPFVDVKEGAYYYDAVLWAVEQKITSGTSATTFSPDASCTRAQMVTFLWRAAGSPKVENGKNPFTDVKADAYYYDAVLWAVEKGVTSGTSATTFSPDATVTRGQTVTFLYRNAGSPEVSGTMPFTDVEADAYYAKAVQWAVQQKITTGTSETTFSPMSDCTRGQIVTFLYRAK